MAFQRLTEYGQNLILNALFGKSATFPDTLWLAACISLPTITDTGSTIDEPTDVNYARLEIDNSSSGTFWEVATAQYKDNAEGLSHVEADTDWETVNHYAFCDAVTGGNMIMFGDYALDLIVLAGQRPYINPGAISLVMLGPIQVEYE